MKKVLLSLSLVAFLGLTMTSCLKNDSTPAPQAQDPAIEKPAIDAFNLANAYSMQEKSDSTRFIYLSGGQLVAVNDITPGLMFQVVEPGASMQDTVSVPNSALGGNRIGNTVAYNLITDSTQYISVEYKAKTLDGKVIDSTKAGEPTIFLLPTLLPAWRAVLDKIGKGGVIRITTPSAYAYGPGTQGGSIPANSPLFFEIKLVAAIKNDYAPFPTY